jgi:O-antigen/teichoic acid export membrane protein
VVVDQADRSALRRAAHGSALNLVGAGLSALAVFALTVVVTHGTTRPEAGVFFAATSLFVIATSVGQLGTDTGLVYFCARAVATGRRERLRDYVTVALVPVLASAVLLSVVLLLAAPQVAQLVGGDRATAAVRAVALLVPWAGVEYVMLSATRGLGTMRPYTVVEQVVRPVLQLALAAAVLATGLGVDLAWTWSAPYALTAVLAWWWWHRLVPATSRHDRAGLPWREFWGFTAPRSLASVAQMAMQRLDIVLVAALAGPRDAAVYAAATRFVVLGQFARGAVSLAVQPHLAGALATAERDRARVLYQTSTAWLMTVTWPLFLLLAIDGQALMRMFGHRYETGATVLALLGVAMLIATLCGDVDVMLIMAGRTRASMTNMLVALTLNVGLDLWLIPSHGVTGAATGWACAIAVKNLLGLAQVGVVLRMHPCGRATVLVAAASLGCVGLSLGLARALVDGAVPAAVAGAVPAAVLYAAAIVLLRRPLELDALTDRLVRRSRTGSGSDAVATPVEHGDDRLPAHQP